MGFAYKYTCGDIDQGIDEAKVDIKDNLIRLVDKHLSDLSDSDRDQIIHDFTEDIHGHISMAFEVVRGVNEDMRKAANEQVSELESEVEDLKGIIQEVQE